MNHLDNNKELLNLLEYLIEKYPEQRFSQILCNYGFIDQTQDNFYKEPDILLEVVKERIVEYK